MRVALCLYGVTTEESRYHQIVRKIYSYDHWKKYFLEENPELDVFVHSWSTLFEEKIVSTFNPKKFLFEEKIFTRVVRSCALSMKKSFELLEEYSIENGVEYDIIMMCRMDVIWMIPVKLNEFNPSKFYVSYWGKTNIDKNYSWENTKVAGMRCTHDIFFMSDQKKMKMFCTYFDELDVYLGRTIPENHHPLKRYHIEQTGLINSIDFAFIIGMDMEIEDRCWQGGTPGNEYILPKLLKESPE